MAGWDVGFWHIVALSVIEIYGDFSLRFFAQTNNTKWLVHGLLGYAGVVYMLIRSFKLKNVLSFRFPSSPIYSRPSLSFMLTELGIRFKFGAIP